MTAHMSPGQMARYLARTLPPADVLTLHGHVETCQDCRNALAEATLASLPSTLVPVLTVPGDPHLTEEEMVAFTAHRLPELRQAEAATHVDGCEVCRDSVAAMESERDSVPGSARARRPLFWFPVAGAIAAGLLLAALIHFWPGHPAITKALPALASLRDGDATIELDSNGNLRGLENASQEERDLVRDALRQRSLPAGPRLAVEAPGVLLTPDTTGTQVQFSLTGPVDTRVLSDRPAFTWTPYPGASGYQVLVTSEKFDPLARSGRISGTQWQPENPLPRGVTLLWQVRAWKGADMISAPAPPAPPARFEIASERIAGRLEQLRASPKPSHLLAAVLCAREGLREEASKELQMLARENPDSPLVESLQTSPAVR